MAKILIKKKILLFTLLLCLGFLFAQFTFGQNKSFILSWSTESYRPAGFQGRALPVKNSEIFVAAVAIDNSSNPVNFDR